MVDDTVSDDYVVHVKLIYVNDNYKVNTDKNKLLTNVVGWGWGYAKSPELLGGDGSVPCGKAPRGPLAQSSHRRLRI